MPETIIESALSGKLECDLLIRWLNDESIEGAPDDCILFCLSRYEFVANFLSYLRNQTDSILQTNSNALPIPQHQGTPEKSIGQRKHHRSISDPTCDNDKLNDSHTIVKTDRKTQESPNRERKKTGRRVKTKLFSEEKPKEQNHSLSSDESRISTGVDRLMISSTPMKNGFKSESPNMSMTSPVTPQSRSFNYERCDTPRLSRHSRSQDKSISLADYLVNVQPKSSKKKRSKNTSHDDSETKIDLDLSNSEIFPEIGARKSSSLKSERRRIKPTNIDKSQKSVSLNSFTQEAFQQPSPLALEENLAFKPKVQPKEASNTYDAERNILKQERHKLMEKFNILNTSVSPKVNMPQIKIIQKETFEKNQTFIDADSNKISFKDKIDVLVEIYNVLFKNNLIISINTEIYFLITILMSKQSEEDYLISESQVQKNVCENVLKPIHNSTYFAVKSLWNQHAILEVILDKNSLKTLGENKKVRSFYPDLAKFLLNSYGLKCEAESNTEKAKTVETRASNGMVCFNHETDNSENFPSILSFQNFKKQRDMFYEILRWYQDGSPTLSRSALRTRIKSLVFCGGGAANHAHLASLLVQMLLDCLPPNEQESKLSKLHRRLTCPSAPDSHRLPHFTNKEMFYKEFILFADNESFRVHLRHALASEILTLESLPLGNESSNSTDISKEFLLISKKLGLLSKFLGYVTSLPYSQISIEMLLKTNTIHLLTGPKEDIFSVPKEKVLENNLALRSYSQPTIDLYGILSNAYRNGRITITIPWIVHYLSMLDYTTLRLQYYQNLLKLLFNIYQNLQYYENIKKNTMIYLKSAMGWLFDLPHFPRELFCEKSDFKLSVASEVIIDVYDLIDESILFELCPYLKDVNVLLATSRVCVEKETFRHITPVSLTLNNEDRIRNKEKELQLRLEEEFLKSQPSSTRRVLELVTERVSSAGIKELAAHTLAEARRNARQSAHTLVTSSKERDKTVLSQSLKALYEEHLNKLRTDALSSIKVRIRTRVKAALTALLPTAPPPLHAVACRGCWERLNKWINDHWTSTAVLCKDINEELTTLLAMGDSGAPGLPGGEMAVVLSAEEFDRLDSPAQTIINLKEHCALLLERAPCPEPRAVLAGCARCCGPRHALGRPPAARALLQLSIDCCLLYVSRKPSKVPTYLPYFHKVWSTCCPDRRRYSSDETDTHTHGRGESPPPRGEEEGVGMAEGDGRSAETRATATETPKQPEPESNALLEYFDRILCPRNIMLLTDTDCRASDVWEALADLLVFLLKNDYLSEDSLTEQCLAVYRQDWPQNVLESLSTCMKSVSSRWSKSSTGKFTLFLDFLADYCNDMDYDLVE